MSGIKRPWGRCHRKLPHRPIESAPMQIVKKLGDWSLLIARLYDCRIARFVRISAVLFISFSTNYHKSYANEANELRICLPIKIIISLALASTPPGMPGTHPHQYFGWVGRQWEYPPQPILLHTFGHSSPILDSLRSSFPSAIRCRQFASVRQADSGLTLYCRL